jgi:HTH-type transcriptional regulator/antitoxin HipB
MNPLEEESVLAVTPADWGNIVRDRRMDLRLSQSELAARVGTSRQWIVGFENGRADVATIDHLTRLCEALQLDVEVVPT